ncbi:hypothetical protein C0J52_13507 [Blattella germanica]|nr:hypothetical protein C0J52_13507 [Blattella germanica]
MMPIGIIPNFLFRDTFFFKIYYLLSFLETKYMLQLLLLLFTRKSSGQKGLK